MTLGTLYCDGPLCPFNHRVQIAATELAVDMEVVCAPDIPESIRAANTGGEWPVFAPAEGGDLLRDSRNMVDYLIDHAGEAGEAYRCNPETLDTLDTLFRCMTKVLLAGKPAIQHEFREKLDRALDAVECVRAASDGPYLCGREFSQADGHIAPFLYRLPFLTEIRDHVPKIFLENDEFNAWVDRVVNRPSFRRIAPTRHALRQFYAKRASYGKPMKVGRLHHSGFRAMWDDVVTRVSTVASGTDRDNHDLQEARDLCYLLFRAVALHAKFENLILFPALDAARGEPGFTAEAVDQHDHEEEEMNSLLEQFDRALDDEPGSRDATLQDLELACRRLREGQFAHFDYEESHFMPVLAELEVEQHLEMLRGAYEMCILERPHLIGVMTSYMPIENTLSLLDSLLQAVEPESEQWRKLLSEMQRFLNAEQWLRVVRRFEEVLPTSLLVFPSGHRRQSISDAARALEHAAPVDHLEIPHSDSAVRVASDRT
jgi:glutathione S-transferase